MPTLISRSPINSDNDAKASAVSIGFLKYGTKIAVPSLIGTFEAIAVKRTKIFLWPRLSLIQSWENPFR